MSRDSVQRLERLKQQYHECCIVTEHKPARVLRKMVDMRMIEMNVDSKVVDLTKVDETENEEKNRKDEDTKVVLRLQ